VELLRAVAEGVGLLRARGDRLEATSLRHAWTQIDESLRAGLTYAAWCQQVTLKRFAEQLEGPDADLLSAGSVVLDQKASGADRPCWPPRRSSARCR
jgi:hypothetical protein